MNKLPQISASGLKQYLQEIRKIPMLEEQEEYMLASAWVEHRDAYAGRRLFDSHLKLAASQAKKYVRATIPHEDLIQEANIGLFSALERYNPEQKVRFSTYALHWIRSRLRDFVRKSYSLVKIATTGAQRNLFSNLAREKRKLGIQNDEAVTPEQAKKIVESRRQASKSSENFRMSVQDVLQMDERLRSGGDQSLNAPMRADGESSGEWIEMQIDESADQAMAYEKRQQESLHHALLQEALDTLNAREKDIIMRRFLLFSDEIGDEVATLQELSIDHGISCERVRQIQNKAVQTMTDYVQTRLAQI